MIELVLSINPINIVLHPFYKPQSTYLPSHLRCMNTKNHPFFHLCNFLGTITDHCHNKIPNDHLPVLHCRNFLLDSFEKH